jgi:chaperonin cofactor prefoldin
MGDFKDHLSTILKPSPEFQEQFKVILKAFLIDEGSTLAKIKEQKDNICQYFKKNPSVQKQVEAYSDGTSLDYILKKVSNECFLEALDNDLTKLTTNVSKKYYSISKVAEIKHSLPNQIISGVSQYLSGKKHPIDQIDLELLESQLRKKIQCHLNNFNSNSAIDTYLKITSALPCELCAIINSFIKDKDSTIKDSHFKDFDTAMLSIIDSFFELSDESKAELDTGLINKINEFLTIDGLDKDEYNQNKVNTNPIKQLRFFFHPDRLKTRSNALKWIAKVFDKDAYASNLVDTCIDKIENPDKPNNHFEEASIDDLIIRMKLYAQTSPSFAQRIFYQSVATLLTDAKTQKMDSRELQSRLTKILHLLLPLGGGLFTIHFFLGEICTLYGLSIIADMSGRYFSTSQIPLLKHMGNSFRQAAKICFYLTSAYICYASSLNLKINALAFNSGTFLYKLIEHGVTAVTPEARENVDPQLLIALPENYVGTHKFSNTSLKLVAIPLELYIRSLSKQYGLMFRQGEVKRALINKTLKELEAIDEESSSLDAKLVAAKTKLSLLLLNPEITESGEDAQKAIRASLDTLAKLQMTLFPESVKSEEKTFPTALITTPLNGYLERPPIFGERWGWRLRNDKKTFIQRIIEEIQSTSEDEKLSPEERFAKTRQTLEEAVNNKIMQDDKSSKALQAFSTALTALNSVDPDAPTKQNLALLKI